MKGGLPVRHSRAAEWSRFAGALAVPVLIIEAIGVRTGTLPAEAVLPVLTLGIGLGILAVSLGAYALADIWKSGSQGLGTAAAGIVYAAPVLVLLALVVVAAVWYPPINDVSTDLEDPPELLALARPEAGPFPSEVAALQVAAYPELTPAIYPLPIELVYSAARTLMEDRGWRISEEDPPPNLAARATAQPAEQQVLQPPAGKKTVLTQSRLEATGGQPDEDEAAPPAVAAASGTSVLEAEASTPLFGFTDLVALRLTATPEGTQLDMRSASQIGRHDLGQNARRIRAFMAELDTVLQAPPQAFPPAAAATATASEDAPADESSPEEPPAAE
jgi:hypothetical protein